MNSYIINRICYVPFYDIVLLFSDVSIYAIFIIYSMDNI